MSTTELQQQRKLPVGPEGAPTYIGEFHERIPGMAELFHSYCREHEHFGDCADEAGARASAEKHLREEHSELLAELTASS